MNRCMEPDYNATEQMNIYIDNYLNRSIEPDYKNLSYDSNKDINFRDMIYYNHQTTNKIMDKYRENLYERINKLDKLQYLVNKNSFPDDNKDYLSKMLESNPTKFYRIMNDQRQYKINQWTSENRKTNYCHQNTICESCKPFIEIIDQLKIINDRILFEKCLPKGHYLNFSPHYRKELECLNCNLEYICENCSKIMYNGICRNSSVKKDILYDRPECKNKIRTTCCLACKKVSCLSCLTKVKQSTFR